jgi:hypothetical protein
MYTLTLCESEDDFYCIQATDEAGDLVDLYYLSGETCSVGTHDWTALTEVGAQDEENPDSDDFWRAVDTSITWLGQHKGRKAARKACNGAYEGILTRRDLEEHVQACLAEEGVKPLDSQL